MTARGAYGGTSSRGGHHLARTLRDELTLAQQIEKIGNSVCPDIPAALVRANITGERRQEAA